MRLGNAATLMTIVGVVIGLVALAIAIVFNWGNLRALQELGQTIAGHVTDTITKHLPSDTTRADALVAGESDEPEERFADVEPDPAAPSFIIKLPNGRRLALYQPEGVPLRVVADLVEHWREVGRTGQWRVGNLEWAVRAVGKGNHPWLVQFKDDPVIWRVAYGGRGKVGEQATVTELPVTDQQPGPIFGG